MQYGHFKAKKEPVFWEKIFRFKNLLWSDPRAEFRSGAPFTSPGMYEGLNVFHRKDAKGAKKSKCIHHRGHRERGGEKEMVFEKFLF